MRNTSLRTGQAGSLPVRKLTVAFAGLRHAVLHDPSVRCAAILSAVLLGLALAFLSLADVMVILVATSTVLVVELLNSALEALCDFVEERDDRRIGAIKDVGAAAAGIAILAWVIVLVVEGLRAWLAAS